MDWRTMPASEVGKNTNVKLSVARDSDEELFNMAVDMAAEIYKNNQLGKRTTFIVPVGPVEQYVHFAKMVNSMRISLKDTWFFNMDEYLDDNGNFIPKEDPLSFRGQMDKYVYNAIDPELVMPEEQRWFPTRGREEEEWELIQSLGGIDICFGGVGVNGHVAFNEAAEPDDPISKEEFAKLPTRMLKLTKETKAVNSSFDLYGEMDRLPRYCMSIGMREILSARKIRLSIGGPTRASQMRHILYGPVCPQFPAAYLQEHPDALLYVTEDTLVPLIPEFGY